MLEEVLVDLKEVLQEGVERRGSPDEHKLSRVPGTIRSRVWEICRESLNQGVNQAKQEWKKVHGCFVRKIPSCKITVMNTATPRGFPGLYYSYTVTIFMQSLYHQSPPRETH